MRDIHSGRISYLQLAPLQLLATISYPFGGAGRTHKTRPRLCFYCESDDVYTSFWRPLARCCKTRWGVSSRRSCSVSSKTHCSTAGRQDNTVVAVVCFIFPSNKCPNGFKLLQPDCRRTPKHYWIFFFCAVFTIMRHV